MQHLVEQQSVGFGARLEAQARALRAAVLQRTGIPVSIGIAPTKTLAKVANRFAKKDPERVGVLLLLEETAQDAGLSSSGTKTPIHGGCRLPTQSGPDASAQSVGRVA